MLGRGVKYQLGFAEELCPAPLTQQETARIQAAALQVHEMLRLGSYSRVDFILGEDGISYCLEANTLPGMTPTSLLPQEAAAAGIAYPQLCEKIVALAVEDREGQADIGCGQNIKRGIDAWASIPRCINRRRYLR